MSDILLGEAFSKEDVTQMCAATGAGYLCADSVRIWNTFHSAGDLIIEAGPSAASIEFVF